MYSPTVIRGFPDSEPVLRELQGIERYRQLAEIGLKRNDFYQIMAERAAVGVSNRRTSTVGPASARAG